MILCFLLDGREWKKRALRAEGQLSQNRKSHSVMLGQLDEILQRLKPVKSGHSDEAVGRRTHSPQSEPPPERQTRAKRGLRISDHLKEKTPRRFRARKGETRTVWVPPLPLRWLARDRWTRLTANSMRFLSHSEHRGSRSLKNRGGWFQQSYADHLTQRPD